MKEGYLNQLLEEYTRLAQADRSIIIQLGVVLQYIANLTESDVFVDALTTNGYDSIVLEWARPASHSLYSQSVVGKLAHPYDEPAVYKTLLTGEPSFDVRGLNQERTPIAQTVVPVYGSDRLVIAALIMERDITEQVCQEIKVEMLSETAEQLSKTLMGLTVNHTNFADQLSDGVLVLDEQGGIKYANLMATRLLQLLSGALEMPSQLELLPEPLRTVLVGFNQAGPWSQEIRMAERFIKVEGIPLLTAGDIEGAIIILSDLTDLRKKEKELILKSVAIQEIHHRVKNNLQNIASLLRLQMRRTDSPEIRAAFTESINRILSMSVVYDVLASESIDEVEIKELCTRLVRLLLIDAAASGKKITYKITGSKVILPSSEAVTLTLIINELVSNSLRHAFINQSSGTLKLKIGDLEQEIILTVSDNGPGFTPDELKPGHLGLQIVRVLVEEKLGGRITFSEDSGTVVTIRFPKIWGKEAGSYVQVKDYNCG